MKTQTVDVVNKSGLHARPAATFARAAQRYSATVQLRFNGKTVNAKSTVAVLSAGICCGSKIELIVEGDDEAEALQGLTRLLAEGCGEV